MIGIDIKVETKKDTKDFLKDLQSLADKRVLVGVPSAAEERKAEGTKKPMTNASLAYIHDNGAPSANIPARPFMLPGIAKVQDKINRFLKKSIQGKLEGDKLKEYDGLYKAGLIAQNSIRNVIMENEDFAPLKRATALGRIRKRNYLKKKFAGNSELKEQYINSFKALIDTGQLLKAITFVIEKLKK